MSEDHDERLFRIFVEISKKMRDALVEFEHVARETQFFFAVINDKTNAVEQAVAEEIEAIRSRTL